MSDTEDHVEKTDADWRAQLTPEQYAVARQCGTERAFTGVYWNHKEPGIYRCVCCGAELFDSKTKFDSGTGWPSFYAAMGEVVSGQGATDRVKTKVDRSYGMTRIEIECARCDAHLGHVFPDGPNPTGLRYCVNSASLSFESAGAASAKK
ncbi:MAG: peptide-methionine (R)-S-oxide reductase MsrB [Sandaracinus sp.]